MGTDVARLINAIAFAAERHAPARRKGDETIPYINHPLKVMQLVATYYTDERVDVLIAAVLHDVVEDTDTTIDDIQGTFGPGVAHLVGHVTDDKTLPWKTRKHLQETTAWLLPEAAAAIRIADKIANLQDLYSTPPKDWTRDRRNDYREWTRRVVEQCEKSHQTPFPPHPLRRLGWVFSSIYDQFGLES